MKNRIELAKYFKTLGFKKGAEIGVDEGRYAEILCKLVDGLTLYCIDSWANKTGKVKERIKRNKAFDKARTRLEKYDARIINRTSKEASNQFEDGSLDFVFIDANHDYLHVKEDIQLWAKKVRKGGIVSGHDYYVTKQGNTGVIKAVDEYVAAYGQKLQLTDWDLDNPVNDDKQPCWFFIKK